jgi:hypothetical protein
MRRNLECVAASQSMDRRITMPMTGPELTRDLEELIAALDRRVPRVEQAGEAEIARDAATLRAKAVDRLAELARVPFGCSHRSRQGLTNADDAVPDESV